jgi:hypothetical protein
MQVYLPTVSVQLAFELVFSDELWAGSVGDVVHAHGSDGSEMLAVRTTALQVLLFAINATTGQVVKLPEVLEHVVSLVALDVGMPHSKGVLSFFIQSLKKRGSATLATSHVVGIGGAHDLLMHGLGL